MKTDPKPPKPPKKREKPGQAPAKAKTPLPGDKDRDAQYGEKDES